MSDSVPASHSCCPSSPGGSANVFHIGTPFFATALSRHAGVSKTPFRQSQRTAQNRSSYCPSKMVQWVLLLTLIAVVLGADKVIGPAPVDVHAKDTPYSIASLLHDRRVSSPLTSSLSIG